MRRRARLRLRNVHVSESKAARRHAHHVNGSALSGVVPRQATGGQGEGRHGERDDEVLVVDVFVAVEVRAAPGDGEELELNAGGQRLLRERLLQEKGGGPGECAEPGDERSRELGVVRQLWHGGIPVGLPLTSSLDPGAVDGR